MTYDNPLFEDGLDWGTVSHEQTTAAQSADEIPVGTHEGVLIDAGAETVPHTQSPLYGKVRVKTTWELYIDGRTRRHYVDLCGETVNWPDGRLTTESKLAGNLAKALGLEGKPLKEIVEAAKAQRVRHRVGHDKNGRARTYGISAVK